MTYSNINKLITNSTKDVSSLSLGGQIVRRESARVSGHTFYRFISNPGLTGEFTTFWSTDEGLVLGLVVRRIK